MNFSLLPISLPRTRWLVAGALLLASVLLARAAEPIKIGEIGPFTGKEAAFGQAGHRGVQMAVDEINARGGILGRPLVIVSEDNQSKSGDSATIAKKLVNRDKVVAVVCTGTSSNCLEVAPICQAARIPFMATTATEARVTAMGNYVFRVCFIDPFQGRVLANFSHGRLKAKRIALLTSATSSFSVGLSKAFRERFTALGGEIPVEQKYSDGDKDFRAQLTAIKAARPDAIAITGYYTEAALVCKQARDLGITLPMFGGDGWEAPELVEIGGKAMEGTYYVSHYTSESTEPEVREFVRKFQARYQDNNPDSTAPLAYDAIVMLADALNRAGSTDGAKLRAALASTKDFPGVTGKITIDAERNASKPAVMITVKNGKPTFLATIAP